MNKKILVIGSANIDMVIKTDRFPDSGETLLGGHFFKFPGGKGANQAVAAARLGGDVAFICKVGKDDFGLNLIDTYEQENIDTSNILIDNEHSTGVALISVNKKGENKIVVAPGANGEISLEEIKKYEETVSKADIIIMQLEIPIKVVGKILEYAKANDVKVILNPAPAQPLPSSYFKDLFLITPNKLEAEKLTGITVTGKKSIEKAVENLHSRGVQNVIITLGEKGAFLSNNHYADYISTVEVDAVDTTAAGDVFNGALSVAIMDGKTWREAVGFACTAAALSVTKNGAQGSVPTVHEIEKFIDGQSKNR